MPRSFFCYPRDEAGEYIIGTSHYWSVESSPLRREVVVLACPFHDGLPNNEGPFQSEDMLLAEALDQVGAQTLPRG